MLIDSKYDREKTEFLLDGITNGFDLGYRGPQNRCDTSANLPFRGVGDKTELWNKIMKEVKNKRYAGPFRAIPYSSYMQSPIGLVPKAGNQTRLIFHLSYDFGQAHDNKSFNYHTPDDMCKVKYRDLDHAIRNCLRLIQSNQTDSTIIWLGITDLKSAFRVVPGRPDQWRFLLMKAQHPTTGTTYFFADKALPFGASISCNLYSEFSNALVHLLCYYTGSHYKVTNYLDDFLFIETTQERCNHLVSSFVEICNYLNVPIADDKVVWANTSIKFLGVIINGSEHYLQIPVEKCNNALNQLLLLRSKRTATVKEIQQLTGLLNFLAKVIVPGRCFTRRMYSRLSDKTKSLKQHHHVTLDSEFRNDADIWISFLSSSQWEPEILYRPFIDLSTTLIADEIDLYSDSSANPRLGFGGIFGTRWFFGQWESDYI